MALSLETLTNGLQGLSSQSSANQAAQAWTQAYVSYAEKATDVSLDVLVTSNQAAFLSKLSNLFETIGNVSAAYAAEAFGAAFTQFWTGATFGTAYPPSPGTPGIVGGDLVFSQEISSTVIAASPASLVAYLTSLFQAPTGDSASRYAAIAQALHMATTQVVVLISGIDTTVPTPLPITCSATLI